MKNKIWFVGVFFLSCLLCEGKTQTSSPSQVDPRKEAQRFYHWILANSNDTTGLPTSHVGDSRLRDWCHTYDAAVTTLAFLAMGDKTRATRILDFYLEHESTRRLGGVIEAVLNFSKEGKGIEWQVRTGSNMWLGIAAFHGYLATGENKYLEFAKGQARFALAMQDQNPMSSTYGGVPLGPRGVPYNLKDQHILWDETKPEFVDIYSTEGNLDVWALLNLICSTTEEEQFVRGRNLALLWLKKVGFNAAEHRFNRGYYREPDPRIAPDTYFWAISALGPARLEDFEPGLADRLVTFMEQTSEVSLTYKKPDGRLLPVKGYDFVDKNDPVVKERGSIISPEWTLQAVLAYALLAQETRDPEKQKRYRAQRADLLSGILLMADRDGAMASLPYATAGGVAIGHEYNTPEEGSRSVIGAAWAILALLDYDPLNLEKTQRFYRKP